jgi:endoglucanase
LVDAFQFVSRHLDGNGTITALVNSQSSTIPSASSGVMIRNDLTAGSAFADVVATSSNSVCFQWRASAGAAAQAIYADGLVSTPIWVRLTRLGNTVGGWFSYDGYNWVEVGAGQPVALGANAQTGLAVTSMTNADLNTGTFTKVSVTPAGWTDVDIGANSLPGTCVFDGANWTLSGSGLNISGLSDRFHFTSESFVGDVSVSARISQFTNATLSAKMGVMIRESLAANARYAFMLLTPNSAAANFECRSNLVGATVASTMGIGAPAWVRLTRVGNQFTAYYSTDGVDWIQNGSTQTIAMSPTVQVGLAANAANNTTLNPASFSNVSVTPAGWSDADIGSPNVPGSAIFDGLSWIINGGGTNEVGTTSDQLHLASQSYVGDVIVAGQVGSLSGTGPNAAAGFMIRDGAAANASYAFLISTPQGLRFESRNGPGNPVQIGGTVAGLTAPVWLKLSRLANSFSGSYSTNGTTWAQVGTNMTVAMRPSVSAGLAVHAHDATRPESAVFNYASIGTYVTDLFLKANGQYLRNGHGNGDVVMLRGTGIGSYLMYEPSFGSMDSSGMPDAYTVYTNLTGRFGVAGRNRVEDAYQFNWITATDFDRMKAMGMNCVRLPFWYLNMIEPDGTWRSDAFTHLDYFVNEAWKRGIYTVIDFHGMPGGQAGWASSGYAQGGSGAFWWVNSDQNEGAAIWYAIAAHFKGNPAVAAYDLMNEPAGAPDTGTLYNIDQWYYWVVRGADQDHNIQIEGWPGWYQLPNPSNYGFYNVTYHGHIYAFGANGTYNPSLGDIINVVNSSMSPIYNVFYSYNIPVYCGEFAGMSDPYSLTYQIQQYNNNHISWANWLWKANDVEGSAWAETVPITWPWVPNLKTDSLNNILSAYATQTSVNYKTNSFMWQTLGMPQCVPETYATLPGQSIYVSPTNGVLVNDIDPRLAQTNVQLSATLVNNPNHGTVTLWSDGSFYYTPTPGFVGTDNFRYKVSDGNSDSCNIAAVSIQVGGNDALPPGWSGTNVAGGIGYDYFDFGSGIWTVAGGGSGISGSSDQYQFASQAWNGDGTMVARVSALGSADPQAKAGVMFRDSTAPDALQACVSLTPSGLVFEYRDAIGGGTVLAGQAAATAPVWVKLMRNGNSFSGFYSTDGSVWTQIGPGQSITMSASVNSGLAVTAHNPSTLNVCTFQNVSLEPGSWNDQEIGNPGLPGGAWMNVGSEALTILGSGSDIWGTADAFHFINQPLQGDGVVVARIGSLQNTDPWAKAGVMIRENLSANSKHVFMALTSGNGAFLEWRTASGGSSGGVPPVNGLTAPHWVKLARAGNTFTGSVSSDGSVWTVVATTNISMSSSAYAGLALTAHNNAVLNAAGADNLNLITPAATPGGLTATPGSGQVALAWNAAAGATSYNVQRSTTNGGPYLVIAPGLTNTNYTDMAVTNGITYYYVVTAVNPLGETPVSNQAAALIAPLLESAGYVDGGLLTLSWPVSPASFSLYSTPDLQPPVIWSLVTNDLVQQAGRWTVNVTTVGGQKLFRLQAP